MLPVHADTAIIAFIYLGLYRHAGGEFPFHRDLATALIQTALYADKNVVIQIFARLDRTRFKTISLQIQPINTKIWVKRADPAIPIGQASHWPVIRPPNQCWVGEAKPHPRKYHRFQCSLRRKGPSAWLRGKR